MEDNQPQDWILTDQYDVPGVEGFNTINIHSEEQLRSLLEGYVNGKPRELYLKRGEGPLLLIGIGGPLAGVLYSARPVTGRSVFAKARTPQSDQDLCFISEGIESPYPANCLMPPKEAIDLVCHIVSTDTLPNWVEWVKGWAEHPPSAKVIEPSPPEEPEDLGDIPF